MYKIKDLWNKYKRTFLTIHCVFLYLIAVIWGITGFIFFLDVLKGMDKIFDSTTWQPSNRDLAKVLYLVVAIYISKTASKDGAKQFDKLTENNNN